MRILVVDDHQVVRRGVCSILESDKDIEVCGEAADGLEAVAKAQELMPDAIVMDISMPTMNGLEATREITRLLPQIPIIILSQHDSREMMRQALKAGAQGYVVKSAISTNLMLVIDKFRQESTQSATPVILGNTGSTIDVQQLLQRNIAFETALRQTEDRLSSFVEYQSAVMKNMAEGLYTLDVNGLVTYINPAGEALFGWTKEELLGKKMHDMTHYKYPDGRSFPSSECPGLQVLQQGMSLREHEDLFLRKDGTFMPVVFSASPLKEHGNIVGVIVGFRDDTEARRDREALLHAKRELEITTNHLLLVTSTMAASVTRCSCDLRYLWANQCYADWIQRPLSDIIEQPIIAVLGSKAFTSLLPYFQRVLSGEKVAYEQEVYFDGIGHRWVSAVYTPTLDSNGILDGWVGVVWDITDRKVAETPASAELAQAAEKR